jgi:hypothetical protein
MAVSVCIKDSSDLVVVRNDIIIFSEDQRFQCHPRSTNLEDVVCF